MLWRNEAAGIVSFYIGVGYRISGVINFTDIDSAELEFFVCDMKSILLTNSAFQTICNIKSINTEPGCIMGSRSRGICLII